jgi:hypothetical protein
VPKITNDLDKVKATLRFRKLKLIETLALVEEIEQLRAQIVAMEAVFDAREEEANARLATPAETKRETT